MSWNKRSFNDKCKNTYYRHKYRQDLPKRQKGEDDYHPHDYNLYEDKPFYAWNDCPCCPAEVYITMGDVRMRFLRRMLWKLGINMTHDYDDFF